MTAFGDKLKEAFDNKNNNIKSFVWKFARKPDGSQEELRLIDATPEQLKQFYAHCQSMLYSTDKLNPGRYVLLDIINDQRKKCNVELMLRKLESGEICVDKKPYPRYLYLQDLSSCISKNKKDFPAKELKKIPISAYSGNLPREFERIPIEEVLNACMDGLGIFDNKHITFSFILNLGVYLTPAEMKEFDEKDNEGNSRSKMEIIKERLNIKNTIRLTVKESGLNFNELRAMLNLKPKKYSELTTDQLTVLRNKVLFKLESEVQYHASQWEERERQLLLVADAQGINLEA